MPVLKLMFRAVLAVCALAGSVAAAHAHEGHDHDKPPPLALPVAPRVVAVTPDFELVGVASGKGRLTVFLHGFATNEPIKGASMTVSRDDQQADAKPEGDGVFSVAAPWLSTSGDVDLVFALRLADGSEDLLTGTLKNIEAGSSAATTQAADWKLAALVNRQDVLLAGGAGLVVGVLLTLLFAGGRSTPRLAGDDRASQPSDAPAERRGDASDIRPLRRSVGAIALMLATALWQPEQAVAADAAVAPLPSIPSTMATDLAQRTPDGTLFVPKATQHLLSIRTMLTAEGAAPVATELTGTIVAGPANFGRVQPGRPGRIEAAPGGLAYVGKRVNKGELLAYVQTYIEAADRLNIDSSIAETEARIEKNRTILSRYEKSPGSVPQVKVDEVQGELQALERKRAELLPSVARREPIVAPISGVVSLANATIGQIVEARDVLFEIVDPSELWIEPISFDQIVPSEFTKAVAVTRSGDQVPLTFMGSGAALRQQATVLTFKMQANAHLLAVGAPVQVVLQSTTKVNGFVIPASAVVRGQTGLPIVWIKTDAERFEPQVVKTAPLDGTSIVVTSGLRVDKRVVTDGVTLLNQVR